MTNLLCDFAFGNSTFGLEWDVSHPALYLFGFPIYLYALVIVTGMCLAILVGGLYFKKRGYDPYDITIYALVVIPIGVLGARLYVYIFPWSGHAADWSTFFDFRGGGLGIYGGVILGYVAAFVCAKIKKQDFRIVTDSLLPGVLIAQSLGRWGNFFNQEAYGNLITADYNALPNWFEALNGGPRHGFNGYAVWIVGEGWCQATFFYESVCTLLGFLICVCVLTRSKHYKLGWCTAFYGIYYGIVRLIIEGMRTDSLYLYIGHLETDIKISQLVSVFTIVLGILLLSQIYRKQIHSLYSKMFKDVLQEMSVSRWLLLALSVLSLAVGVTMFALGGESKFIIGFFATVLSAYSALGIWSLCDRMKLYCSKCKKCVVPPEKWQTDYEKYFARTVILGSVMGALFVFGTFSLVKWGIVDGIPNGVVLFVLCVLCIVAFAFWGLLPAIRGLRASEKVRSDIEVACDCGETRKVKLNYFLLFLFPPKTYRDFGVENIVPWVDPQKEKRKKKAEEPSETDGQ